MAIIVQKYGGSSVSDLTKIRAVAERVANTHRAGDQVVVVVSAMGNTTNELIALAHGISAEPDRRELDMLVSVGERVSMSLLGLAGSAAFLPARRLGRSLASSLTNSRKRACTRGAPGSN